MSVSKDEASSALQDIEATERRSRLLFGYGLASPYLLMWGSLWLIAGTIGAVSPAHTGIGWSAVDIVGLVGNAFLMIRQTRRCGERSERVRLLRYFGTAAVLVAFIGLTLMVLAPLTGIEILMFFTLLVAAGFTISGCWSGQRYAVVGIALGGLAVGVFLLAPAYLHLIVPFAGGGALILGGLWLRRT